MVRYKKRGGGGGRKMKMPSKNTFDYQYYDLNLSAEEMAEMYQVKVTTIYNWATQYRKEDKENEKVEKQVSEECQIKCDLTK